jgi:hypothetical protein
MNKKLPTADMVNELAGASVFFQSPTKAQAQKDTPPVSPETRKPVEQRQSSLVATNQESSHDTAVSSNRDTKQRGNHPTKEPARQPIVPPIKHDTMPASSPSEEGMETLMEVRKLVRQLGKEAATHRFTAQEKRVIADLVYTYSRQGYRTSENEITRIAVNWILLDFEERGEQSILARMLESLHG